MSDLPLVLTDHRNPHHLDPDIKHRLDLWAAHGYWPGDCLGGLLAHDFQKCLSFADARHLANLGCAWVYIFNALPGPCHGSQKRLNDWTGDPTWKPAVYDERGCRLSGGC